MFKNKNNVSKIKLIGILLVLSFLFIYSISSFYSIEAEPQSIDNLIIHDSFL